MTENNNMSSGGALKGAHSAVQPNLARLSLMALGVVYGDLGTSTLYTLPACFALGLNSTPANVVGVVSLILWALVLVVCIKYAVFVLRADNNGEGGILALMSLVVPADNNASRRKWVLIGVGIFGAALLYGDGVIMPAITMLSATEGLTIAQASLQEYVLPLAIVLLVGLFAFQRFGTAKIGMAFGPILLIWFVVLALLGIEHIVKQPGILRAINPIAAVWFFAENGALGFFILGAVVLAVTGCEAMYADLGHFGRRPIRTSWFVVILPALWLNYLGQGAVIIAHPDGNYAISPLYHMVPHFLIYPMILLATLATIVASQSIISGAYSLTMQAIQWGFSPRMAVRHTSPTQRGQIYLPAVNWVMMIICIALVIGFKSSANLAAAYGVAVSTTMVITTLLFYLFLRQNMRLRWWSAGALCTGFMIIDLGFATANWMKIPSGGWVPLAIAAAIFTLLSTWKTGREILGSRLAASSVSFDKFRRTLSYDPPTRVPGVAVFMQSNPNSAPSALLHNVKHNKVIHEHIVLLNIHAEHKPYVNEANRIKLQHLEDGVYRVTARYGFMEEPYVPKVMRLATESGLPIELDKVTYFVGNRTLVLTKRKGLAYWRKMLFAWMARNERGATEFFNLPANRVVELGVQVKL